MMRAVFRRLIFCLLITMYSLPASASRTALVIWDWWSPDVSVHTAWFNWVEQEFEKANPDIDVQYTFYTWGEYLDKLSASLATGVPPDVLQLPVGWGRELFEKGALLNLAGYISRSPEHQLRNYVPVARHYVTARGGQFGVPLVLDATALVYNRKLTKDAGIHEDSPRSISNWNDFITIAKKLTRRDSDKITQSGYVFWMGLEVFSSWLAGNGSLLFSEDHSKTNFNTKAAKDTLTFLRDLKNTHRVFSETVADFYANEAAMYSLGSWTGLAIERDAPELSFGMASFPPGPSSKKRGLVGWTNMLAIPKLVENSDAAWRYVAFCTGTKAQAQLAALGTKAAPARLDYYRSAAFSQEQAEHPWMRLLPEAAALDSPIIFYRTAQVNLLANQVFSAVMAGRMSPETALTQLDTEVNKMWRE